MVYSLQVDSGFFLESDVKIVGKSIRDRVALIKWRRQRVVSGRDGQTDESGTKTETQNLLQVPSTGPPAGGAAGPPPETEEPTSEPISLVRSGPTSATTATREEKYVILINTIICHFKCNFFVMSSCCLSQLQRTAVRAQRW